MKLIWSISSAILLIFAFPVWSQAWLAWIALVPFFVNLFSLKPKDAFREGILFGFLFFLGTQYWIYYSINNYGGMPFYGSISVVMLLCLYESLYTGVFAFLLSFFIRKTLMPVSLLAPFLWVTLEYLRGLLLTGFPWSFIGHTQSNVLPLIQILDLTGVYGLSFLIVLVNSAIVDLITYRKYRKLSLLCTIVLFSLALIYGHYRLQALENKSCDSFRIAIVQGNIDQSIKWNKQYRQKVMNKYVKMSEEAITKYDVKIIFWPETALPFYFGYEKPYTDELIEFVKKIQVPLLTGTPMVKEKIRKSNNRYSYIISNSAILITPDGNVASVYDKIHLVPFGEYVPLRKLLFFIDKVVEGIGDFKKGEDFTIFRVNDISFFTVICYEAIFSSLVRKFKKGDFIVNITNDAWFGKTGGPYQHFEIARLRAVENRIPLIRAANTGISGVVDYTGRVVIRSRLFEDETLVYDLKTCKSESFYKRYGDLFVYLNILVTSVILIYTGGGINAYCNRGKRRISQSSGQTL